MLDRSTITWSHVCNVWHQSQWGAKLATWQNRRHFFSVYLESTHHRHKYLVSQSRQLSTKISMSDAATPGGPDPLLGCSFWVVRHRCSRSAWWLLGTNKRGNEKFERRFCKTWMWRVQVCSRNHNGPATKWCRADGAANLNPSHSSFTKSSFKFFITAFICSQQPSKVNTNLFFLLNPSTVSGLSSMRTSSTPPSGGINISSKTAPPRIWACRRDRWCRAAGITARCHCQQIPC